MVEFPQGDKSPSDGLKIVMQALNDTWKADHFRMSFFSDSSWAESPESIFNNVFQVAPDSLVSKVGSSETVASGPWGEYTIEIKRIFNRVDVILRALPFQGAPISFISNIPDSLPTFVSFFKKWAANQDQTILRVALGCGAYFPVADVGSAYIMLKELIGVINVDVDRFREFQFQVNLPEASSVYHELLINRLTSWSSLVFRAGVVGSEQSQYFEENFYCACGIDVNTDGNRSEPILTSKIENLLSEITEIALKILSIGIK